MPPFIQGWSHYFLLFHEAVFKGPSLLNVSQALLRTLIHGWVQNSLTPSLLCQAEAAQEGGGVDKSLESLPPRGIPGISHELKWPDFLGSQREVGCLSILHRRKVRLREAF